MRETIVIRDAGTSDTETLARLWYDGWRDAHLAIVPESLTRMRTLDNFRERLVAALADTRVAMAGDAVVGFSIVKDDELYQLYVAAPARGTGVAAVLGEDAEARLAARGVKTAWLACTVGNDRAARFYEKTGWRRVGTEAYAAETAEGPFTLDVWRYEKDLAAASRLGGGGK